MTKIDYLKIKELLKRKYLTGHLKTVLQNLVDKYEKENNFETKKE